MARKVRQVVYISCMAGQNLSYWRSACYEWFPVLEAVVLAGDAFQSARADDKRDLETVQYCKTTERRAALKFPYLTNLT